MFRCALDALRTAQGPLTVRETTDAVMTARKVTGATAKQRAALEAAIRSCLETNVAKTIQRVREGVPKGWRIA